jgi:hypothetical protein
MIAWWRPSRLIFVSRKRKKWLLNGEKYRRGNRGKAVKGRVLYGDPEHVFQDLIQIRGPFGGVRSSGP